MTIFTNVDTAISTNRGGLVINFVDQTDGTIVVDISAKSTQGNEPT